MEMWFFMCLVRRKSVETLFCHCQNFPSKPRILLPIGGVRLLFPQKKSPPLYFSFLNLITQRNWTREKPYLRPSFLFFSFNLYWLEPQLSGDEEDWRYLSHDLSAVEPLHSRQWSESEVCPLSVLRPHLSVSLRSTPPIFAAMVPGGSMPQPSEMLSPLTKRLYMEQEQIVAWKKHHHHWSVVSF